MGCKMKKRKKCNGYKLGGAPCDNEATTNTSFCRHHLIYEALYGAGANAERAERYGVKNTVDTKSVE
jgi:hypothetical protein